MATQILTAQKCWLDGYNLSGDLNAMALRLASDVKDDTAYGDATRSSKPGLITVAAQHEGFWNDAAAGVDPTLFNLVGVDDRVMSLAPLTGAEGEVAYSFQPSMAAYSLTGKVGEMLGFSVRGEATSRVVRGTILLNGAKSATGAGGVLQLGAVAATQKLYAALHILSVGGSGSPNLTAKVQSAAVVGFGSPTDRITFAGATAIGSQWATPVAGAISDQYWRVSYTLTGTTPVFSFVLIVGIQ